MAYASSVTGSHLRVTRLDKDGTFLTGVHNSFTTKSFISVSFTPEYEDGDEFTQKNAGGTTCIDVKAPDTLRRVNLSVAVCNPDPVVASVIAGGQLLVPEAGGAPVGWAAPKAGEDPVPDGVAIEVWSNVYLDGKPDPVTPYIHWIFPYAKMRESGERVVQNDILATEFEGWSVGNRGFGSGPAEPVWPFIDATESPYSYAFVDSVPTATDTDVPAETP